MSQDLLAHAFRESLDWEAEHVFLREFAEEKPAVINGTPLTLQVIGPASTYQDAADGRMGVKYELATLHIKSGLVPLPRAGRKLVWDDVEWMVQEAKDNKGIYRIELYREVS